MSDNKKNPTAIKVVAGGLIVACAVDPSLAALHGHAPHDEETIGMVHAPAVSHPLEINFDQPMPWGRAASIPISSSVLASHAIRALSDVDGGSRFGST